jgi:GT2 family glycosyltransferase
LKTTSVIAETFSVIIPSWNGTRLLPACLESLRAQTYRNFQVLVVDNASTDGTPNLVQRDFREAQLITLARNRGFTGATNVGIARSTGTMVALMNQDVEADPHWLEEIARAAQAHPEAGAIACKIMLYAQRDHFHSAGDIYRRDGIPINRGVWELDCGQYDEAGEVFSACGGAGAYRRHVLDQIGTFDESFFMYLEDVDLAWRQQMAGWPTIYAPRAVAFHHLSASGGGLTASYYTGRNTIYVVAKNMPSALLCKFGSAILTAQSRITRDALCAWRGTAARARLRGQLAGLLTWPRMLSKRRQIQRTRRVSIAHLEGLLEPID